MPRHGCWKGMDLLTGLNSIQSVLCGCEVGSFRTINMTSRQSRLRNAGDDSKRIVPSSKSVDLRRINCTGSFSNLVTVPIPDRFPVTFRSESLRHERCVLPLAAHPSLPKQAEDSKCRHPSWPPPPSHSTGLSRRPLSKKNPFFTSQ